MIKKFKKKPVVIQAMQFNDDNTLGVADLRDWLIQHDVRHQYVCNETDPISGRCKEMGHHLLIETLEGAMRADDGDWIIKGIKGEFYPCKPDIFADSYEEVESV